MSEHHELSPSRYSAWAECLDWVSDGVVTNEASAGTDCHKEIQNDIDGVAEAEQFKARWAVGELRALAGECKISAEVHLVGSVGRVKDVFGTADAVFRDAKGTLHIADFKTFSDGTNDYRPQLKGYGALSYVGKDEPVVLHVLHGGVCKIETFSATLNECHDYVEDLLKRHEGVHVQKLNAWCKYCGKAKECSQVNNAVQVVSDNRPDVFGRLSLPQKLVILDAVDKLSKSIREEAKKRAKLNGNKIEHIDDNGNVVIKYELVPWAGKAECKDICGLAGAAKSITLKHRNRDGSVVDVPCNGLMPDEFVKLCSISKTDLVNAIREKNSEDKAVKKVDIEYWLKSFFVPTEGTPHFVRTV